MEKIELLAPAGNLNILKAAVDNGADAIYLGGENFSARAYADNFTNEEIVEGIKYAHVRGAKVYVSINTLVYDDEINDVFNFTDFLYLNDVDALIVADFGLINALKNRYSSLAIHVSTQLNTHSLWQVKLLESLNVSRVILARETELSTIKYIKQNSSMPLEVFAHGALCVCYSGNCLQSSLIGKRSGNRGKCAQPCRMQYTLLENNKAVSNKKFLLSLKDLNTLEHIGDLIEANVTSLKIEGRMKSVEYVALVTKTYRDAIDNYYAKKVNEVDYIAEDKIKMVFSRGFSKGFMFKELNGNIAQTYRPSHIGEKIGKVIGVKDDLVQIKLSNTIHQKDKIAILQERADDVKMFLSKIYVKGKLVPCGYKDEVIEISINSKVSKDSIVYKMVDNALMEETNNTYLKNKKKVSIRMKFIANVNEPMALIIKDNNSHSILVKSDYVVEKAINSPTSDEKIKEQLSKVFSTAYEIKDIVIVNDNQGIIPVKFINDLRREAISKLDEAREKTYNRSLDDINTEIDYLPKVKNQSQQLKVKVHTLFQLDAIANLEGISAIYYDDMPTYSLAKNKYPHLNLILVLPRINNDRSKIEIDSPVYVCNNYGDLLKHDNARLITDMYMNVTNKLTIASLLKLNVETITISCEMNHLQIKELVNDFKEDYGFIPPLEMVVYGHYQTMITKYCFISNEYGFSKTHCGACKNKNLALLDRMNYIFPITTDNNCNVTIYNSKATHLISYLDEIYDMGINSLRLDFSIENPQEVHDITKAYLDMIKYHDYDLSLNDVTYAYFLDSTKN